MKKFLAILLAMVMVFGLVACNKPAEETSEEATTEAATEKEETTEAEETETEASEEETEETTEEAEVNDKLVYVTSTFGQKFSPFFYTTAYDGEVVSMVTGYLLAADRGGAVIENGIEGEDRDYNGTSYHYDGMGNVEVVQNDDGTVDYNLTMREGVKFSDGEEATIDDVIFGIYVLADPTYDGSSTIYALPIKGMEEYRSGMETKLNLILATEEAGYEENEFFTEDEYNQFWDAFKVAGGNFCEEIHQYCVANGYNTEDDGIDAWAANWGYEVAADGTVDDMFQQMIDNYGYDLSDDGINLETAGTSITDFILAELGDSAEEFTKGIQTGAGADYIEGIEKTGDYSMTVHMTEYDAVAIYDMSFIVAPLHYYGDEAKYDYDAHKFGFDKGDLSSVKAVTTKPLGCGPYVFEGYENGVVTFSANENYFLGAPETKTVLFAEGVDSDYVPGIITGTYDIAQPSINDNTVNAIKDANSEGELVGDTITTYLVDYRGYGYLGISADLVNINDDPGSDESKALRKGFMTLFSVYRDTVINSYYGDRAAVIQYPISNTSWAAPKPADEGYKLAYSVDADGNDIYTDDMTDEEKYEAAKEAAITWFKAAGFTFDEAEGKFTDAEETYEVMIPGSGEQDHPAYGVAVAASEVLEELGIKLQVNDVSSSVWNDQLEANTAIMWAAAWQSSVDPDMTQVYTSQNAHGQGTNSNHYSVCDDELDALIAQGRASADIEERKSIYKEAMEIIMDWGVELPLYQRKDCTTVSTIRVNNDTMPKDMTPYWGWAAELEKLSVQ